MTRQHRTEIQLNQLTLEHTKRDTEILEILSLLVTDTVSKVAELHAWLVKTLRPYLPININNQVVFRKEQDNF